MGKISMNAGNLGEGGFSEGDAQVVSLVFEKQSGDYGDQIVGLLGIQTDDMDKPSVRFYNVGKAKNIMVVDDGAWIETIDDDPEYKISKNSAFDKLLQLDSAVGFFPMADMRATRFAGRRIALIAEAAHAFPPLAAQGLNLSLRDIAALLSSLKAAGQDIGALAPLRHYAEAREADVDIRVRGIDILNRSMLSDFLPVDMARGFGFFAM